jgi:hypothetical protein
MLPLRSFKHTKMQFQGMSTHLGGSFYCDITLVSKKIHTKISTIIKFLNIMLMPHIIFHDQNIA